MRAEIIDTARRIVAGEIPAYEGAAYIWRVMAEIDYEGVEDFRVWVGFTSEWQDAPQHRDAIEGDILDEAERVLRQH